MHTNRENGTGWSLPSPTLLKQMTEVLSANPPVFCDLDGRPLEFVSEEIKARHQDDPAEAFYSAMPYPWEFAKIRTLIHLTSTLHGIHLACNYTKHDFDVRSIVQGAPMAYLEVSRAMYNHYVESNERVLASMCTKEVLDTIVPVLEEFRDKGMSIPTDKLDEEIKVTSCYIKNLSATKLTDSGVWVQTEVCMSIQESFRVHGSDGQPLEVVDAAPRLQESIWKFEALFSDEEEPQWKLAGIGN